jgi:hypothetical protein
VSPAKAIGAPNVHEANRAFFESSQILHEQPDKSRILCCRKGRSQEPRACQVTSTRYFRICQTSNPRDKTSEIDGDRINDEPRIERYRAVHGLRCGHGSMMISMADLYGGKRYRVDVVSQGLVKEQFTPLPSPKHLLHWSGPRSTLTTNNHADTAPPAHPSARDV